MAIKIKRCIICGATFDTNKPNKKYCSFVCKEAGAKLKRLTWKDKNPGYINAYMQKYRKEKKK